MLLTTLFRSPLHQSKFIFDNTAESSRGDLATQWNLSPLNFLKTVSKVLLVGATPANCAICFTTGNSSIQGSPPEVRI